MAYSGYSTDNSDTDQNNSYQPGEKHESKTNPHRRNNRKRFAKMRKSWRFMKMRKLWEKDMAKQRRISAPFVAIKANNKRESMTASLLFMFAVVQCICGFVLPICDSFGMKGVKRYNDADHKYYLEIFLISQYCGAVLVLAYLQFLIHSGTKKQAINTALSEIFKSRSTCKLVDDKSMVINEHHELSEPNSTPLSDDANPSQPVNQFEKMSDIESTTSDKQYTPVINYYNHGKRYISLHPEGMNLYMRLGAVGFGLGVMIHDGFNLSSVWEVREPVCHSKLWIPKHIIRIIWVLWQTYFIFKYHRVILHVHRVAVRLAYIHLATINFCHWLKVVVGEVANTLKTPAYYTPTNQRTHISKPVVGNHSYTHNSFNFSIQDHSQSSLLQNRDGQTLKQTSYASGESIPKVCLGYLGVTLGPFLFPLAIEYSLITGSFFYKMLQRVDQSFPKSSSTANERLGQHSPSLISSSPSSTVNSMNKCVLKKSNSSLFQDVDEDDGVDQYYHQQCTEHLTYRPVMGCQVFLPILKEHRLPILNKVNEDYQDCEDSPLTEDTPQTPNRQKPVKVDTGHQCHRSHSGLFLGIMLLIASIVCMVLFLLRGRNGSKKFAAHIYQKSKIALSSIGFLACVMAILQTNKLKFRRLGRGESFEYNLLTIGLIGCITYHMFLFIPALETVIHTLLFNTNELKQYTDIEQVQYETTRKPLTVLTNRTNTFKVTNDYIQHTALLYLAKCTLEILQALLQFFFIVETSRRKVCCINQARIKPGRSVIVFLLICNL
ncbi:unnamed protein product, partial [Heterobilharzia americana]